MAASGKLAWMLAALASCMPATAAPPAAPAPRPPPPVAATAPPAVEPEPSDLVVEVFEDERRRDKLLGALDGLDELVAKRAAELDVAGLFVGVVIDGELARASSYGTADAERGTPVDADTVFRIGSITKPITTMAVLKLRDEGKVSLDVPASRYLPELDGLMYPTKDAPRITLRHLLTHTAGLPRGVDFGIDTSVEHVPEEKVLGALRGLPLAFVPGTDYRYSNLGFALVGLVVARAAKMPYRRYLKRALFDPLGWSSAGWDPDELERRELAASYARRDGKRVADASYAHLGAAEAGGGLYLSGRDLARFVGWQLSAYPPRDDRDGGPLARASIRESHAPGRLIALNVAQAGDASPYTVDARAVVVGLSWHGWRSCELDRVVHHNGLIDHHASDAALLPQRGVGVVVLANTAPVDLGSIRDEVLARLERSGGLEARVRVATRAPKLDAALAKLLEVQNRWDAARYQAMLSASHRQKVPMEQERAELADYRALHGACSKGRIIEYESHASARYLLACERGRLEMALWLEAATGKISGFVGTSSAVPDIDGARAAAADAVTLLNRWDAARAAKIFAPSFGSQAGLPRFAARHRDRHGRCTLGDAIERDGNRFQRYALACERGGDAVLSLKLAEAQTGIAELLVRPAQSGSCPRK